MKPLAFALLLLVCAAAAATDDPATKDVVEVAKDAKAKRKKSTSKVITNADVKKSKGKLVTTNVPEAPAEKVQTLMEQAEAKQAAAKAAADRRAAYETAVADLEKELAAIEQQYYDENDLSKRDTEIVKKFNDVKAKLDAVRADEPPKP